MPIFSTVEFYVIAVIAAAAIVGLCALPRNHAAVRNYLLAGDLTMEPDAPDQPAIELLALPDGNVRLTRRGLQGLTESCAVSLAIDVKGFDVEIRERISGSTDPAWQVNTATFVLTFLARERYHFHYVNPDTGLTAATAMRNRPGTHAEKALL